MDCYPYPRSCLRSGRVPHHEIHRCRACRAFSRRDPQSGTGDNRGDSPRLAGHLPRQGVSVRVTGERCEINLRVPARLHGCIWNWLYAGAVVHRPDGDLYVLRGGTALRVRHRNSYRLGTAPVGFCAECGDVLRKPDPHVRVARNLPAHLRGCVVLVRNILCQP